MPRLRLTHRADNVLHARPDRFACQPERPQRLPDRVVLASLNHPEQQMLSTDLIVAVTAGLRMGPSDSASRRHAEYVEHANTQRAQPITGLLTMDLLADEFDSGAD
jgi:hypothetical protein